jgi:hypothetical protein
MANKKVSVPVDEKFQNQDFDLFGAFAAIDKKDYTWYSRLSEEQKKKFVPYMMLHWISAVKGKSELQQYYLQSVDHHANKYYFHENIYKHPELQWMLLCASSPGMGKQAHQWIPHLKDKMVKLKEPAKEKDVREYFTKIYPKADAESLEELTDKFIDNHKKRLYIAKVYPNLKFQDIETLVELVTDEQIDEYERDQGN